jgi:hypothetical protein
MSETSMWRSMSLKDDVSDSRSVVRRSSGADIYQSAFPTNRERLSRDKRRTSINWSFAVAGAAIAALSVSWIAYGLHRNLPASAVLLGVNAAVLVTLVLRLSYLTIRVSRDGT